MTYFTEKVFQQESYPVFAHPGETLAEHIEKCEKYLNPVMAGKRYRRYSRSLCRSEIPCGTGSGKGFYSGAVSGNGVLSRYGKENSAVSAK